MTVEQERDRWIRHCLAALCARYQSRDLGRPPGLQAVITLGVDIEERCHHEWCYGVVDVLRRAIGDGFQGGTS